MHAHFRTDCRPSPQLSSRFGCTRWGIACLLMLFGGTGSAQDFASRADTGERVMATEIGDAYLDAIAPTLHDAVQTCRKDGHRMKAGEAVTLVAQIAQSTGMSPIEVEPATQASECIAKQLQAAKLPLPDKWEWQRGDFPLTLRLGAGRGTVDGLPEEG